MKSLIFSPLQPPVTSSPLEAGIALGCWQDDRGFESRQGVGIYLSKTASRPALGPTQSPIQWVPGALPLGGKAAGA
jgi:hypothetical protein